MVRVFSLLQNPDYMPTQATTSDSPFYDQSLFHKKLCFSKNFDNVNACNLPFRPLLRSKILATPMYLVNVFVLTLIAFLIYLNCACAIALKIAEILAAQASAQPFKNNYGTSAIARNILFFAAQVPTSDRTRTFTKSAHRTY